MPKLLSVSIIMPAEMWDRLLKEAIRQKMARDYLIQQAITKYLEHQEEGE